MCCGADATRINDQNGKTHRIRLKLHSLIGKKHVNSKIDFSDSCVS